MPGLVIVQQTPIFVVSFVLSFFRSRTASKHRAGGWMVRSFRRTGRVRFKNTGCLFVLFMIPFRIAFLCTCTGRVHEPPCFSRDSREGRASRTPVPVGESIIRQVASGKWQVQELLKAKFTADSPCTTQQKILRSAFSRDGGGGTFGQTFVLEGERNPSPRVSPPRN